MLDKKSSMAIVDEIRRVLMVHWDPIGVADVPEAADEYDRYLGGVVGLLERDASEELIAGHLRDIEVRRMGLTDKEGNPLLPEGVRG